MWYYLTHSLKWGWEDSYLSHGYYFTLSNNYEVHSISFQTFFVWVFRIAVDSWQFSMLLLYILWDDRPIFYDFRFKWTPTAAIGIHPDCHSWSISKMQSDTLEERYAIKLCFKLGKMPQKRMECFRLLLDHLA